MKWLQVDWMTHLTGDIPDSEDQKEGNSLFLTDFMVKKAE